MTRDEQINQYCNLIGFNFKPSQQQIEWFTEGAHWADTHPEWHNARTERPKDGESVLVVVDCGVKRTIQSCVYHECDKWMLFGNQKYPVDLWMPHPKIPALAVMD